MAPAGESTLSRQQAEPEPVHHKPGFIGHPLRLGEMPMIVMRLPHHFSHATMLLINTLASHLGGTCGIGPLPDYYVSAIAAAPTVHFIEQHVAPGESPLLVRCEDTPPVEAAPISWDQHVRWMENDHVLAWGFRECWELPAARLNGLRIEMIPKVVFDHPALLVGILDCPPLGDILFDAFRTLAADIPVEHPAFGFYPGSVPLGTLSLLLGGVETLNLEKACSFVTKSFPPNAQRPRFLK
jgi:hypothetical protein